jgi:hypothetical protein
MKLVVSPTRSIVKNLFTIFLTLFLGMTAITPSTQAQAQIQGSGKLNGGVFPIGPDPKMTPGSLCDSPAVHRYPEGIAYCDRNVDSATKKQIILDYDQNLGFNIHAMNRGEFKIDHYIPLCAGGSNHVDNLWPQHRSVFEVTDPLEQQVCIKMSEGHLKQADAILMIREGKANLSKVESLLSTLESM